LINHEIIYDTVTCFGYVQPLP